MQASSPGTEQLPCRCPQEQIKKLEKNHAKHIAGYGEGNERRLTGKHETSSMCASAALRLLLCAVHMYSSFLKLVATAYLLRITSKVFQTAYSMTSHGCYSI